MKFSSKVEKCTLSPVRKFAKLAENALAKGREIYYLNIGQPDIETPPAFMEAIRKHVEPVLAYGPSGGLPEYLAAVRRYYAGLGINLGDGDILATGGGSEALSMTMACLLDEGDNVVIPEPFYTNYNTFVHMTGAEIKPVPTTVEEGYFYADRARLEAAIDDRTRAILVTNPGNPTGSILTREEMRMIAELAREKGIFLVADEVYREFVYGGEQLSSFAEFYDLAENIVVVDSVSKRFSACGARVGAIICRNREFMAQALKLCQGRLCVPTIDQVGAAALYDVQGDYFAAVRDEYRARRDASVEALEKLPGVKFSRPKGAFYIMVSLPVDSADSFQKWLLESFEDNGDTVMFTPAEGFYATPGKGVNEFRMAYVKNSDKLRRAIELIGLGLEQYPGRLK